MVNISYIKYGVILEEEIFDLNNIEIQDDEIEYSMFQEGLKLKIDGYFSFEDMPDKGETYIEDIEIDNAVILDENREILYEEEWVKEMAKELLECVSNVYFNDEGKPEIYVACITYLPEEIKNNEEIFNNLIEKD